MSFRFAWYTVFPKELLLELAILLAKGPSWPPDPLNIVRNIQHLGAFKPILANADALRNNLARNLTIVNFSWFLLRTCICSAGPLDVGAARPPTTQINPRHILIGAPQYANSGRCFLRFQG
ncbi:hypothetical protein EDD18DRAFT_1125918 [Armillaria luteobubalina]|uniref:Uncharacterized protein n=1 Tax=Armillaria luteobubalina TaxID=153913 RepID=A0AA39QLR0_9AGAR|nr:hypothetical protein EDD18DRAFT_1125918 [Armillaria luteobubalina]